MLRCRSAATVAWVGAMLAAAALSGSAQAATVSAKPFDPSEDNGLTGNVAFVAAPGEHNRLMVTVSGGRTSRNPMVYLYRDTGATLHGKGLCKTVSTHTVRCTNPYFESATIKLGDQDDRVSTDIQAFVFGGRGDDVLDATHGVLETLVGGPGNDRLYGSGTSDTDLDGGSGDDFIDGGRGRDEITGGPGIDTVTCGSGPGDTYYADQGDLLADEPQKTPTSATLNVHTGCDDIAIQTESPNLSVDPKQFSLASGALSIGGTFEGSRHGLFTVTDTAGVVLGAAPIISDDVGAFTSKLALTAAGLAQLQPGTTSDLWLRLQVGAKLVSPAPGPGVRVTVSVPAA